MRKNENTEVLIMNEHALAQLLFPQVTETPEDLERRYPPGTFPPGQSSPEWPPVPPDLSIWETWCRAWLQNAWHISQEESYSSG